MSIVSQFSLKRKKEISFPKLESLGRQNKVLPYGTGWEGLSEETALDSCTDRTLD